VIVAVAGKDVSVASDAVYVKESLPLKSALGVYVNADGVPESVPCEGPLATANISSSPSTSAPSSTTSTGASSSVSTRRSIAVGRSLTGSTVTETTAVSLPLFPSETAYTKEAGPE
jgi:hypothetical protein